jgi:ABC-type taurine transport system substrate-binding protein
VFELPLRRGGFTCCSRAALRFVLLGKDAQRDLKTAASSIVDRLLQHEKEQAKWAGDDNYWERHAEVLQGYAIGCSGNDRGRSDSAAGANGDVDIGELLHCALALATSEYAIEFTSLVTEEQISVTTVNSKVGRVRDPMSECMCECMCERMCEGRFLLHVLSVLVVVC